MLLRHIPNFCLQHDDALSVLRLEWVADSNLEGLQASAHQLMQLLQELAVRRLLLDMDTVPDLPIADQIWLGDQWMPALVASGLERLVLVINGFQVHNQLAIDALHDLVQPAIRFDSQYFSDSESALLWLTDEAEQQVAALEAEWQRRHDGATAYEPEASQRQYKAPA